MFHGDIDQYISVGHNAVRNIEESLKVANLSLRDMHSILDMPSGHGRVLRSLISKVSADKITACDILPGQIDFCEGEFKCKKHLSSEDLLSIKFPNKYSLIWVGSLFTHLDLDRFTDLITLLVESLEKDGVLVFTTHGKYSVEIFDLYWTKGFVPMSKEELQKKLNQNNGFFFSPYLNHNDFGISISEKDFVLSMIDQLFKGEVKILRFAERGWDNHQDVYAIQKV
jgi:hypothetical protein